MKIIAIIQARIGSKRLPGKVLMDIGGKPMICFMLDRVSNSSKISETILATGDGSDNDELAKIVADHGFKVFRSDEDDVLKRYTVVANVNNADIIVRLTGDCPLMDPAVIDKLVNICIDGKYDYVTNVKPPTWPDGLDISVFTSEILNKANKEAEKKSEREHVVPWMWKMSSLEGNDRYKAFNVACDRDLSKYRFTVDEKEDYEFIKSIVSEFGSDKACEVNLDEIINLLENKQELLSINKDIERDMGYKNDIKKELYEGERIFLRDVEISDVNDNYYNWMNDKDVTQLTASRGRLYNKEELIEYAQKQKDNSDIIFKAIVLKENDKHIGNIKLGPIDKIKKTGDMGLIIGEKKYWGKGYGTEAIGLFCDYVFKAFDIETITAGFFLGNEGSRQAFLKNGFKVTHSSKKHLSIDNTTVNVTWMTLNRK